MSRESVQMIDGAFCYEPFHYKVHTHQIDLHACTLATLHSNLSRLDPLAAAFATTIRVHLILIAAI